ncbi:MAG TPA: hypothetical protein VMG60_19835 [Burkholderiaceae bacterium]|nr:hypothetical protein [Burkholderiaceae bacterium]
MKRVIVGCVLAGFALGAAGLLLWPRSQASAQLPAQLNADECTCSRPTVLAAGREQISIYACACPSMQCVITATAAGTAVPPNIVQSCRAESSITPSALPPSAITPNVIAPGAPAQR